MKKWKQNAVLFGIGAAGYSLIEIAARGYTHWTMTLTGGVCAAALYHVHGKMKRKSLWTRCAAGAAVITAAEFGVGLLVNRLMRWDVWDYSDRFLNVLGQICPRFAMYWFLLNVPLTALFAGLERYVFSENRLKSA